MRMRQILQRRSKKPGTKTLTSRGDTLALALPENGLARTTGPDGNDAGRVVPSKQVFVFEPGLCGMHGYNYFLSSRFANICSSIVPKSVNVNGHHTFCWI